MLTSRATQLLERAAFSLRAACTSSGRQLQSSRAFSSEGAAPQGRGGEGVKAKLFGILESSESGLTADEVWGLAKDEGLKSKRFTKLMLQDLKQAGYLVTRPSSHKAAGGSRRRTLYAYWLRDRAPQRTAAGQP